MSDNLPVEFTIEPMHMAFRSESEGRPIYEDREFIRIYIPGNRSSEVYREATDKDRKEYADAYKKFKDGLTGDDQLSGTPLSAWPAMTPSLIREFQAAGVKTVEHLANLSDTAMQNFMGAREWVVKANAYIKQAEDSSFAQRVASENEALKRDMEMLKQQMAELGAPKARKQLQAAE
jgi:hypothetical protein